jgi:hypothetical protein
MTNNFLDADMLKSWIYRNGNCVGRIDTIELHTCFRVFEENKTGKRRYWSHDRIDDAIEQLVEAGQLIHSGSAVQLTETRQAS